MSWRQPARIAKAAAASSNEATRNWARQLIGHLRDLLGVVAFEQLARVRDAEARVLRFNAEEKPVAAGAGEVRRIEYRMIGLRQAVQGKHPEDCGKRCAQHRAFKRYR